MSPPGPHTISPNTARALAAVLLFGGLIVLVAPIVRLATGAANGFTVTSLLIGLVVGPWCFLNSFRILRGARRG